ncbi:MAG: hypothetical protein DRJ13_11030, partial [Bacteroidetes bacterium]
MKIKIQSLIIIAILTTFLFSACDTKGNPAQIVLKNDSATSPTAESAPINPPDNPVEVWAVLAAKDDYSDVGMTDMLVDYIDLNRVRDALISLGWDMEQMHFLKGFDQMDLQAELDWLQENADENDLVFFYVTAHGTYLRKNILWNSIFPPEWAKITSSNRVLVVDSCSAAEFTNSINGDPNPHLSIAAVDVDEYGWKGLEEEGLPVVGGIFTFYFAETLVDPLADANGDGLVSVQEAALTAEEKQREYMHEVVFAVPEFVE